MKKIISISVMALAITITPLSVPVQADTYVYQNAEGLILLTDHRIKKRGYKLKRVHKDKFRKKHSSRKKHSAKRGGFKIGCGNLSSAAIDQKTRPYLSKIRKYSRAYGVDEHLVRAIIRQESCFKPRAKSRVGAMGLMQLMPKTAKHLGIRNAWNPDENIEGGVRYISRQLKRFNGNKELALAAYNAGPGAVIKYNGIPPFRETQNYVGSIMKEYKRLKNNRITKKYNPSSKRTKMDSDFYIFWGRK